MPAPKHVRQLTTWQVFRQVKRRFRKWKSNRKPLSQDLGISSPSSGGLRSSRLVYLELRSAIMSYSGVQFLLTKVQ
jgi:hypothetical protein